MLVFGQIQSHYSAIFKKFCFFDIDYENYAIVEISTKKKIICGAESIKMWISADEAYRFSDFSSILIMTSQRFYIGHISSDLRSEYQM